MDKAEITARVRQVMSFLFAIEEAEICDTSSIDTIEKWDSLEHVKLMMALEENFGLKFEVEDAMEMTSFPNILEKVEANLGASAS